MGKQNSYVYVYIHVCVWGGGEVVRRRCIKTSTMSRSNWLYMCQLSQLWLDSPTSHFGQFSTSVPRIIYFCMRIPLFESVPILITVCG